MFVCYTLDTKKQKKKRYPGYKSVDVYLDCVNLGAIRFLLNSIEFRWLDLFEEDIWKRKMHYSKHTKWLILIYVLILYVSQFGFSGFFFLLSYESGTYLIVIKVCNAYSLFKCKFKKLHTKGILKVTTEELNNYYVVHIW